MRGRDQLWWLATGVPPRRIGWGPGPLTAVRLARHRRLRRPVRLTLLEHADNGTRFAASMAFWVNECSRVSVARVNASGPADVAWVLSQDPLPAPARRTLADELTRLRPAAVVNPLAS